ncbi:MAG TPA: NIPSNAP family protein [Stellaceae bacterium]|nr:NIPSNAP family protein [Stellaceae bacterium]
MTAPPPLAMLGRPQPKMEAAMILEVRTYTAQPGKAREWLEYYENNGLPVQKRMLGRLVGFFTSELGPLNQIVHMWAYESLADREQRRAALAKEPEWHAYLKNQPQGVLAAQETRILVPTSFSPLP